MLTDALWLSGPRHTTATTGHATTFALDVAGANGAAVDLALLDAPPFVTLDGDKLRVMTKAGDISPCAYRFRVLATAGDEALPDVLAVELRVAGGQATYLPAITRGK